MATVRAVLTAGLLALFAGLPASAQPLPHGLGDLSSLHAARQRLWELREAGRITQTEYLQLARRMEPALRSRDLQPIMDELGIRHTGKPPIEGGGIFSDVDGTAPSEEAYRKFLQRVQGELDPDVEVFDRHSFRSKKFDIVGWRPQADVPQAAGYAGSLERGLAQSLNEELAPSAIPGRGPAHPLEANLENLTKGAKHLFKPLEAGYEGEAALVAAGKDTLRSMQAAGLCRSNLLVCRWLTDLRSRTRSPSELGFRTPAQLQQRLRELSAQAYQAALTQFEADHAELMDQLRRAGTGPERDRLLRLADEMAERATRMAVRYETLHRQFPEGMSGVSGDKPPKAFWQEQNQRIRQLRQGQQAANNNVTGTRGLTILLNLAEFARCMDAGGAQASEAQRAKAAACIAAAVRNQLVSMGAEQGLGRTLNWITVKLPHGVTIARIVPAALAGVAAIEAGLQVIDAGFEYWLRHQAELEEQASLDALEHARMRNVAEFPRRLAAAERLVAQSRADIDASKDQLLRDLTRLAREQAALIERVELQPRRKRLEALLPSVKADAQACWAALGRDREQPLRGAAAALDLLLAAARDAAACANRDDLQRAERARQLAAQQHEAAERTSVAPTVPPAWQPAPEPAHKLEEVRRIYVTLEELALATRANQRALAQVRTRVEALNASIASERDELGARVTRLLEATPDAFRQLLDEHSSRARALQAQVEAIESLPMSAWHPQWSAIRGNDAALRALLSYLDDAGRGVARAIAEAEDCQRRRAGIPIAEQPTQPEPETWPSALARWNEAQAACLARLDLPDARDRFQRRVAQEQASLHEQLERLKQAAATSAARLSALVGAARARVLEGERSAASGHRGSADATLAVELADAEPVCRQLQSARAKLADTLQHIAADGDELEAELGRARELARACAGERAPLSAQRGLDQAAHLQTRIDQRSAALALLAVQVEDLAARRDALLKARARAARDEPAAVQAPIDWAAIEQALAAIEAHGPNWAGAEASRLDRQIGSIRQAFALLPEVELEAGLQPLHEIARQIVGTAWTADAITAGRAELAALRQRAAAGATAPASGGAQALKLAAHAARCLDAAPPDLAAGLQQAQDLRDIAQLATHKLGAGVREALATCKRQLAHDLNERDKRERVANKTCRYPGSEAVWDESSDRPVCRCKAGMRWNGDRSACVADPRELVARADCSAYPHTEPRWNEAKAAVVCSCKAGYRRSAGQQACEAGPEARADALARLRCTEANTRAVWDAVLGQARCGCAPGYTDDPGGGCMVDRHAAVMNLDCSRHANTQAYWNAERQQARCRCSPGFTLDTASRSCVSTQQRPPPQPAARSAALAGWVGRWTCVARADARVRSQTLRRGFPERLVLVFAEDGRGGLMGNDGEGGPWGPVPLIDNRRFQLPAPAPEATPLVFELGEGVITGRTTIRVDGARGAITLTCRR